MEDFGDFLQLDPNLSCNRELAQFWVVTEEKLNRLSMLTNMEMASQEGFEPQQKLVLVLFMQKHGIY